MLRCRLPTVRFYVRMGQIRLRQPATNRKIFRRRFRRNLTMDDNVYVLLARIFNDNTNAMRRIHIVYMIKIDAARTIYGTTGQYTILIDIFRTIGQD